MKIMMNKLKNIWILLLKCGITVNVEQTISQLYSDYKGL